MFGEDDVDAALEEAWVYRTIKDFEYIIISKKYDDIDFTTILSNDAKKALLVMLKDK